MRRASEAGTGAVLAAALAGAVGMEIDGLPTLQYPALFVLAFGVALAIAFLHALFIAAPFYLFLIRRWPLRWWSAGLGGLLIGALPSGAMVGATSATWSDAGWRIAFGGACGLVGGLTFRALRGRDPRKVTV